MHLVLNCSGCLSGRVGKLNIRQPFALFFMHCSIFLRGVLSRPRNLSGLLEAAWCTYPVNADRRDIPRNMGIVIAIIVVAIVIARSFLWVFLIHIVFGDADDMFIVCIHLRVGHFWISVFQVVWQRLIVIHGCKISSGNGRRCQYF
ncbi:hypothetical protein HG531_007949 [Fusarium graminearum]|nr:hypothetical protein HG531_007949 [Fusarium graminearum]